MLSNFPPFFSVGFSLKSSIDTFTISFDEVGFVVSPDSVLLIDEGLEIELESLVSLILSKLLYFPVVGMVVSGPGVVEASINIFTSMPLFGVLLLSIGGVGDGFVSPSTVTETSAVFSRKLFGEGLSGNRLELFVAR